MSIRIRTAAVHPVTDRIVWRMALNGEWPAEALSTAARGRLVRVLHQRGWTDVEIAAHTRMTTYTTARIRGRLGLAPNPSIASEVA